MVAEINGTTVVSVTVKQLILGGGALVVALAGALWAVNTFSFGYLKDDVADIRKAVTDVSDRNADTLQTATSADAGLSAQIAGLTSELKITNSSLANLTTSVAGLNDSVKSVDDRLAASVARQVYFERWVVTRLGNTATPTAIPADWQKAEGEIVDTLTTGEEPLAIWNKFASQP